MKCRNCGAEIKIGSKYCDYCGAAITSNMIKEQETLNKKGCPKCGSTNITFEREDQGVISDKKGKAILRATIGVCKDCGYTWQTAKATAELPRKRRTWLWVLGWLFIFPVPLTVLLLRKKEMKPALKYGIIAAAWIAYFIIGFCGRKSDTSQTPPPAAEITTSEAAAEAFAVDFDSVSIVKADDGTVSLSIGTKLPGAAELLV